MRIISTVPSQTELLADLSLEKEVVGITKFCVHPDSWYRNKTRIGGTKNLNIDKIRELRPDLVIANKEENVKDQIEELSRFAKVLVTEIKTPDDNLRLITDLGQATNRIKEADQLKTQLASCLKSIRSIKSQTVIYLIWSDPYMTVGGDTYINAMLDTCGLKNVFREQLRYPQLTISELQEAGPDLLFLSSEPFPFKEKHLLAFQKSLPKTKIHLVDGEIFSWYGTRLIKVKTHLDQLLKTISTKP